MQVEPRDAARPVVAAPRRGPAPRDLEPRRAVARRETPERHARSVALELQRSLGGPVELAAARLRPLERRAPALTAPAARSRHRHHGVARQRPHLHEPRLAIAHVHDRAGAVEVDPQEQHVPQADLAELEVGLRQQRAAHLPQPPGRGLQAEPLGRAAAELTRHPQRAPAALHRAVALPQHAPDPRRAAVGPLLQRQVRGLPLPLPGPVLHGRVEEHAPPAAQHRDVEGALSLRRRGHVDPRRVRAPARQFRGLELRVQARAGGLPAPRPVVHLARQVAGRPAAQPDRVPVDRIPVGDVTAQVQVLRRVDDAPDERARRGGAVERPDRELAPLPAEAGARLERDAVPDRLRDPRAAYRAVEAEVEVPPALAGDVEELVLEYLREPLPAHAREVHRREANRRPPPPAAARRERQVGRTKLPQFETRAVARDEAPAQRFEGRAQRAPRPAHPLHLDLVPPSHQGAGAQHEPADVLARIGQVGLPAVHGQPHVELARRPAPGRPRPPVRQAQLPVGPAEQVDDRPLELDLERTGAAEGQVPGRVAQRHRARLEQGRPGVATDAQARLHDGHAPEHVAAHVAHLQHQVAVVGQHPVHHHREVAREVLGVLRQPGQRPRDQHHDDADRGEHDEPRDAPRAPAGLLRQGLPDHALDAVVQLPDLLAEGLDHALVPGRVALLAPGGRSVRVLRVGGGHGRQKVGPTANWRLPLRWPACEPQVRSRRTGAKARLNRPPTP